MLRKFIIKSVKSILGKNILRYYRTLVTQDQWSIDEKNRYQFKKLEYLLKETLNFIPYYKDVNLDLDKFDYKEFCKLPLLTKDMVRSNLDELINTNNCLPKSDVITNTSGGSTGSPVKFYQTKGQKLAGHSNYLYANHLNGIEPFDRSLDLWGATRDMHAHGKSSIFDRVKGFLDNRLTLNTFVMSEEIIKNYINEINLWKPKLIKAYVHSIYDIAKYINLNKIPINFVPIIHTTTGPLYPEMRKEIQRAFNNAKIFSFYGSREVSAIATEVAGKTGMQILYDNVFVEVLDKNDNPVSKGEEGEIVITTLNNFYMPLFRYKIGDRAIKGDNISGALILDKVLGRTLGVIYKRDGSSIDGQYFTTLFFGTKGIDQFQMIQKSIDKVVLNIRKGEQFDNNELDKIVKTIKNELGEIKVDVIFTEKLNLSATGKVMYVYSELLK